MIAFVVKLTISAVFGIHFHTYKQWQENQYFVRKTRSPNHLRLCDYVELVLETKRVCRDSTGGGCGNIQSKLHVIVRNEVREEESDQYVVEMQQRARVLNSKLNGGV